MADALAYAPLASASRTRDPAAARRRGNAGSAARPAWRPAPRRRARPAWLAALPEESETPGLLAARCLSPRLREMVGRVRITELPHEVNRATGFVSALINLRTSERCDEENPLFLVIPADATNPGLGRVADRCNTDESNDTTMVELAKFGQIGHQSVRGDISKARN